MTTSDEEMDELRQIYAEAWADGIWLCEWAGPSRQPIVAAGFVDELERYEQSLRVAGLLAADEPLNVQTLDAGTIIIELQSYPGTGRSRAEACRAAWKAAQAGRSRHAR